MHGEEMGKVHKLRKHFLDLIRMLNFLIDPGKI